MQHTPYLVGVVGGSGSGKTTVVRTLHDGMAPACVCTISQDDYYLPLSGQARDASGRINFDLPTALDLAQLAADLHALAEGNTIRRQEYTFEQPGLEGRLIEYRPASVILVEGLFLLCHEPLRKLFDLTVFVDASEKVLYKRRLARDMRERGYTVEDVKYQWEHHVMPAYREHLLPYRHLCDMHIVNEYRYDRALDVLHDHLARQVLIARRQVMA